MNSLEINHLIEHPLAETTRHIREEYNMIKTFIGLNESKENFIETFKALNIKHFDLIVDNFARTILVQTTYTHGQDNRILLILDSKFIQLN